VTASALLDTSALLALSHPRDQKHRDAVRIARSFLERGGHWVGSFLILDEFHGHLLQRRGPADARGAITKLLADPDYLWLAVDAELVHAALHGWLDRYHDQHFSLIDAVSFEIMRRERIDQAFAFDQDFVTAGFALLR
jgi:predicted nucleic acid-binding protein